MAITPMFILPLLISSVSGLSAQTIMSLACNLIIFCSVALYGLLLFYNLTKEELKGRRPLAKFLAMKLIVIFTFYQSFVVCILMVRLVIQLNSHSKLSALAGNVIHGMQSGYGFYAVFS